MSPWQWDFGRVMNVGFLDSRGSGFAQSCSSVIKNWKCLSLGKNNPRHRGVMRLPLDETKREPLKTLGGRRIF
jgi:hypothetical protein